MSLLLDTHALLWWIAGDERIPVKVRAMLSDPDRSVFVSAVSAYEITQKHRRGKLPQAERLAREFEPMIEHLNFAALPITVADAKLAGQIAHDHRDPFDRLLIAQALLNGLALVSNETVLDDFGVARLW